MAEPDPGERFTALYDTYQPRVHAYAVSRAGRQLAEEVTSETFCVAWRRFGDLPDPPLPWLLGIARNVLRESYRAQARRDSLAEELRAWTSEADLTGGDVGEAVVERAALLQALARLSDDDRELLTLVAWHGLSPREAAKVVGWRGRQTRRGALVRQGRLVLVRLPGHRRRPGPARNAREDEVARSIRAGGSAALP
jgi:RNA polymerase sigma-70 factor (ECF subfamily)